MRTIIVRGGCSLVRGGADTITLWLNPTGMIETDLLLLAIMQESRDADSDAARHAAWDRVMAAHDVPDAFRVVAGFFDALFMGLNQLLPCQTPRRHWPHLTSFYGAEIAVAARMVSIADGAET